MVETQVYQVERHLARSCERVKVEHGTSCKKDRTQFTTNGRSVGSVENYRLENAVSQSGVRVNDSEKIDVRVRRVSSVRDAVATGNDRLESGKRSETAACAGASVGFDDT